MPTKNPFVQRWFDRLVADVEAARMDAPPHVTDFAVEWMKVTDGTLVTMEAEIADPQGKRRLTGTGDDYEAAYAALAVQVIPPVH